METDYSYALKKIFEIQQAIRDIHPFLEKVCPVAIAENGQFLIYDVPPHQDAYTFIKRVEFPMPIPDGVRAAFSLESYNLRMACVVTGEVFDDLDGYVTIFHEFVHCQQFETCEFSLKQRLGVARRAQEANDYMWEIDHPFPYNLPEFEQAYQALLASHTLLEAEYIRAQLKAMLDEHDYEYMVWQEWKEGFARYIENEIQRRLGLPENHGGKDLPFNRVAFYAGGSHFIKLLSRQEPELVNLVKELFDRMYRRA